jgi:hypothetical protein
VTTTRQNQFTHTDWHGSALTPAEEEAERQKQRNENAFRRLARACLERGIRLTQDDLRKWRERWLQLPFEEAFASYQSALLDGTVFEVIKPGKPREELQALADKRGPLCLRLIEVAKRRVELFETLYARYLRDCVLLGLNVPEAPAETNERTVQEQA